VNSRGSGWCKAQGHEVSRARKNIEQKGVSEDIDEWMQKRCSKDHELTMKEG
jgi:hypothetical protein